MTTKTPPQHGERRCYIAGCRRPECVAAHKRYCKAYRVATHHTGTLRCDKAAAAERINGWAQQGWSHRQMSETTGCSGRVIHSLLSGATESLNAKTSRRILNAPEPTGIPFHATTDATGTIRRGQALHFIGYPLYVIAAAVPMSANDCARLLIDEPATVRVSVAEGMAAAYRQYRWKPGPSDLARKSGRRRKWHGPLAWDDIDNPAAKPDRAASPQVTRPRGQVDIARVARLTREGLSAEQIANRLRVHKRTVIRARARARQMADLGIAA